MTFGYVCGDSVGVGEAIVALVRTSLGFHGFLLARPHQVYHSSPMDVRRYCLLWWLTASRAAAVAFAV